MAETLISPGVLARENDTSQITQGPVTVGAAIIGPSIKGPVEVPTLITSYSEYLAIFGGSVTSGSQQYSYLNQVAANNYFRQGGSTLLVTRVTSGSFSSAKTTDIDNNIDSGQLVENANLFTLIDTNTSDGNDGTTQGVALDNGSGTGATADVTIGGGAVTAVTVADTGSGYKVGDLLTLSQAIIGGTTDVTFTALTSPFIQHDAAFELSTISQGAIMNNSGSMLSGGGLVSGSKDNVRWEITAANTSTGVFSLAIRRGDDENAQKSVLETFNNVSLDPLSTNYIETVVGNSYYGDIQNDSGDYYIQENGSYVNRSKYVYVSKVNYPTPNYFDNAGNAKIEFTGSIPVIGSGSFSGAAGELFHGEALFNENIGSANTQGIGAADYTASINLLSNSDDYQFNVLAAPGLIQEFHSSEINLLVTTAEARRDCLSIIDLRGYGSTIGNVVGASSGFDSSYAATYWPWLQLVDPDTGRVIWSPASVLIPGVYAFTDASSDPWFAPAGLTRGGLGQVVRAERKLTSGNRDSLYEANINPIATFPQSGVVVFGQKTLQKKASALDRVNVRRLLIALKSYIVQVSDNLVFEQNTIATRNNFLATVNPYLESVQQRQGLYAFRVVMDETNNTPDVIDRNEMVGQIYLQPTKTAEFIILDFNVLPTGATFPG